MTGPARGMERITRAPSFCLLQTDLGCLRCLKCGLSRIFKHQEPPWLLDSNFDISLALSVTALQGTESCAVEHTHTCPRTCGDVNEMAHQNS